MVGYELSHTKKTCQHTRSPRSRGPQSYDSKSCVSPHASLQARPAPSLSNRASRLFRAVISSTGAVLRFTEERLKFDPYGVPGPDPDPKPETPDDVPGLDGSIPGEGGSG